MRTGILSDESVLAMCAEYRPVPLGQVEHILKGKADAEPSKLKHTQPPSRPAFFGAMSNSMAKEMDPTNPVPIRVAINEQYVNELQPVATAPAPLITFPATPPMRQFDGSPRLQSFSSGRGNRSPRRQSPPRQRKVRETADIAMAREALRDSEIAARAMHSPGMVNLRNRAIPNVVRATIGGSNLFETVMSSSSAGSGNPEEDELALKLMA